MPKPTRRGFCVTRLRVPQVLVHGGRLGEVAAGEAGDAHGVDEARGPAVDDGNAVVGGVGRDQEHQVEGLRRRGLTEPIAFLWRQVGQDQAIHAGRRRVATEVLDPVRQHGVHVAHEEEGGLALRPKILGSLKGVGERDVVGQGPGTGALDGTALGERIAEGHPQLDKVDPAAIEGVQDRNCGVRVRKTVREKEPHRLLIAGTEGFKGVVQTSHLACGHLGV
jgi:hypothetical protein